MYQHVLTRKKSRTRDCAIDFLLKCNFECIEINDVILDQNFSTLTDHSKKKDIKILLIETDTLML